MINDNIREVITMEEYNERELCAEYKVRGLCRGTPFRAVSLNEGLGCALWAGNRFLFISHEWCELWNRLAASQFIDHLRMRMHEIQEAHEIASQT
jgi:hypothetical protein